MSRLPITRAAKLAAMTTAALGWMTSSTLVVSGCDGRTVNLGRVTGGPLEPSEAGLATDSDAPAVESDAQPTDPPPLDAAPDVDASITMEAGSPETPRDASLPSDASSPDAALLADAGADAAPPRPVFAPPQLVSELNSEFRDDNPTLTQDMLEVYFSSTREGDSDVYFATRSSVVEPFSAPQRLDALSTDEFDSSPAVEPDGLTLWVGSASPSDGGLGGVDIWVSRRASRQEPWLEPTLVAELNSTADDVPRPTGSAGLEMPLSSRRAGGMYQGYLATRATPNAPFESTRQLDELEREGFAVGDAFLTQDGRALWFAYAADGRGDLYVARRSDSAGRFSNIQAITEINTDADDRDPWLSPDGSLLYFASDREGVLNIYVAQRLP